MFRVILILSIIGLSAYGNVEPAAIARLCSDIFNRNITDMNLNFIDQLRDEPTESLASYLKEVGAFKSFSKDELLILARLIKKEEHKDKPTDVIIDLITADIQNTRRILQDMLKDKIEHEADKPSEIEAALEKISELPIAQPAVEYYVKIGNIGDAKVAHGVYRYMVLKPWDASQFRALGDLISSSSIAVISEHAEKGILVIVHPIDLAKLSKMQEVLKEVSPFIEDPNQF